MKSRLDAIRKILFAPYNDNARKVAGAHKVFESRSIFAETIAAEYSKPAPDPEPQSAMGKC